ncbi:hypothetical protein B0T17DRAFT_507043 [Bombardia bombarda]|uniref:LRR-containing protein second PH domain-containing protein n=1 Tax=Bombardia bombarda TaxID=252184 RepID=A0AA39XBC1_9PEZI|nr:hypothetical protein B0T17DRAFT_507043 [Bombardia bombarda]
MSVEMAATDLRHKKRHSLLPLKMAEPDVTAVTYPASTFVSSPVSLEGEHHQKSLSFNSLRDKAWRPFTSRDSIPENGGRPPGSGGLSSSTSNGGSSRTPSGHRRKLSKSRTLSTSFDLKTSRRSSGLSDDYSRMSINDSMSTTSTSSVDWRSQAVEGFAALESDAQLLKTKTPYLVITSDYLIKFKSHADALVTFPHLAERTRPASVASNPEPSVVVPVPGIVSVFVAESTRPSFGIEVWWRTLSGTSFHHATFFFNIPKERDEQMQHIIRAMRTNHNDENEFIRRSHDVSELLKTIYEAEEPMFTHRKLDIFPVVPRGNTRKECNTKPEDGSKKSQEGPAFYLAVGTHNCYLVEIQKGKGGDPICQHRTFGLVTLETFRADWSIHQERFNITFREPFKAPVTLELASRYYRQVIRAFGLADRFLKPMWPQLWQNMQIMRIKGLKEYQHLVSKEDFGSVKRTLDAYVAAYRCASLLAVLRALRYNDYFNSISFRDVDLAALWGIEDNLNEVSNVAYISRTSLCLTADEVEILKISPVLHQEFHALAFGSETIRQIDFTNSTTSYLSRVRHSKHTTPSLQFLAPIMSLLKTGATKCNHLILSRNLLLRSDIEELSEAINTGCIQGLDVSCCGLDDMHLRDMVVGSLLDCPRPLQVLNVSGNPGRLPVRILPEVTQYLEELKELNLCGSLQGDSGDPLIPVATLDRLFLLEELDISNFKLNPATLQDLEQFLLHRAQRMDNNEHSNFRKLVLSNCGITGSQAGRLFSAIGENHGVDLSISGNPLEEGIEELAKAIRQNRTPAALTMEMVEFREESSYLLLIKALTETKYLSVLSMVGTAPTPSAHGPCSPETVQALEQFFARNKSIRRLDLSGYCGKLDDGQLAKGFGASLIGLTKNTTMTHLRVRNQNLHDDAGTLGSVLRGNTQLMVLDCQDNNFNLSSLQYLVSSLEGNKRIIEFPFSVAERSTIWKRILAGLHRNSQAGATAKGDKDLRKRQEAGLWDFFYRQFDELDGYLKRNRLALEEASGQVLDFDTSAERAGATMSSGTGWQALEFRSVVARADGGGGGAYEDGEGGRGGGGGGGGGGAGDGAGERQQQQQERFAPAVMGGEPWPQRATVRSSSLAAAAAAAVASAAVETVDISPLAAAALPYRDRVRSQSCHQPPAPLQQQYHRHDQHQHHHQSHQQDDGGMESPTETLDPVSEISTPPPELTMTLASPGPNEPGDASFRKMMLEFRETGFDFS